MHTQFGVSERGYTLDLIANFTELREPLVRSLLRYCGDPDVAEEAAQEALIAAVQQGDRLAEVTAPWAWLWRVGVNRVHSHHRRVATEQRAFDRVGPPETVVADATDELATLLLITGLTGRYRAAVWLRIVEQRTVAETAAVLGCAEGTVKSLTHRAARQLRAEFAA